MRCPDVTKPADALEPYIALEPRTAADAYIQGRQETIRQAANPLSQNVHISDLPESIHAAGLMKSQKYALQQA
jgi:hypothetical protein